MKTRLLVTGAGGYIGSVATYLFLEKGYEVTAIDNFSTGFRQPLELLKKKFGMDKLKVIEADIRDDLTDYLKKEKGIKAVVHYAASCLVDESMRNPKKYFENNVAGTLNLLETMVRFNIDKIVFSSSAAIYGEVKEIPITEDYPKVPINPYGESKLMDEKVIQWYGKLFAIKYMILRYFNVCGASSDGLIGDSKKPSTLLVQNAVRGALGIEQFYITCPAVDTLDKTPIRDYVNVVDLNEAHLLALEHILRGGKSQILNLGTGTGNSVLEIINKVQEATGVKFEVNKTTPRQGDPARLVASIEKAEKILGWKPKRTIDDSIRSLIAWYQKQPKGWQR